MPYMAPSRIEGEKKYGFEVDFWSLGITMIVILTGRHPYPLRSGLYNLMTSVVKQPRPVLDDPAFPKDVCDFVSACLTQPMKEKHSATTLLNHPFILAAKERGVISDTSQARLTSVPCPKISRILYSPHELAESLVDIAVAWQLERCSEEAGAPWDEMKTDQLPADLNSIRFPREHEAWLASQVHLEEDVVHSM